MMEVRKNREFKYHYVASERSLKQIDKIMSESSELPLIYKVYSVDGSYREFENLDDLLDWDNSKDKMCNQMTIEHDGYSGLRIEISLGNSEFGSLKYLIRGEEKEVDHYSKRIENVFGSMKQWYTIANGGTFLKNLVFGVTVSVSALLFVSLCFTWLNIKNENLIPTIFFIVLILLYAIFAKVRHNIFPVAQFEIGDGIERVKLKMYLRSTAIVLFLGGIVSFIVNQLS